MYEIQKFIGLDLRFHYALWHEIWETVESISFESEAKEKLNLLSKENPENKYRLFNRWNGEITTASFA